MEDSRVGEVIQTTTTDFVAQCYELYRSPPLGSLVKTRDAAGEVYAVVWNATTSSMDRTPIARGKNAASEDELYRDNPQLAKLLKSEFSALAVGHRHDGKLYQYLPPQPARIHAFVYGCSTEETREFSGSLKFLHILINTRLAAPVDEILAASVRQMGLARDDRHEFLVAVGKELAGILSADFIRLRGILGRLK